MTQLAEVGWTVVGSKGRFLGKVEAVHDDHLVVKEGRLIHHTLYIPIDQLATAADGQVTVKVPASDAEAEGWRFPPGASYHRAKPAYPEVPETTTMQAAGMSSGTMSAPEAQGAIYDSQIDVGEAPNTQVGRELNVPRDEGDDEDGEAR